MLNHWASGGSIVIHHNHPSGESLSDSDWLALSSDTQPLTEIFAHVVDGTMYYGAALDRSGLAQVLTRYAYAELAAQTVLINQLRTNAAWQRYGLTSNGDAGLRKHAVSMALARKNVVAYEFDAGITVSPLILELTAVINAAENAAFAAL
jgi:hypothetical protein